MKVHQIIEAGRNSPRKEPKISLGNSPKVATPTTGSLTGITGTKAGFVSKSGKFITGEIIGPSKSRAANQVSFKANGKTFNVSVDKLLDPKTRTPLNIGGASTSSADDGSKRQQRRTPKVTADPSDIKVDKKDKLTPDTDDGKIKPKKQSYISKFAKGGVVGTFIGLGLFGQEVLENIDNYANKLEAANGDTNDQNVQIAKIELINTLANATVSILSGFAAGAITAGTMSRVSILVPGLGWLAALIAGGASTIVAYIAQKAANDAGAVESIARWFHRRIDDELLDMIVDDVQLDEESPKAAIKDLIKSDPKIIKAFKMAQKMHRAKSKAA